MNQEQRLDRLIAMRLAECDESIAIPASLPEKKRLFRALMNVRPPYRSEERRVGKECAA